MKWGEQDLQDTDSASMKKLYIECALGIAAVQSVILAGIIGILQATPRIESIITNILPAGYFINLSLQL